MRVLAFDPATRCGWACGSTTGISLLGSGVEVLREKTEARRCAYYSARQLVYTLREEFSPDLIVLEIPGILFSQKAVRIVWGIVAAIEDAAEDCELVELSPTAVKKHATGNANAGKTMMLDAARKRWGEVADHNQADALWVMDCAISAAGDQESASSE